MLNAMAKLRKLACGGTQDGSWSATLLIRILAGWVFVVAGLEKLLDLSAAASRFEGIGFGAPLATVTVVAVFELLCGIAVLLGVATRAAAVPLAMIMVVALITTKLPNFGDGPLVEAIKSARLDVSLLLASLYLMIAGGGRFALDRRIMRR
jgi:putative oxidoreductase